MIDMVCFFSVPVEQIIVRQDCDHNLERNANRSQYSEEFLSLYWFSHWLRIESSRTIQVKDFKWATPILVEQESDTRPGKWIRTSAPYTLYVGIFNIPGSLLQCSFLLQPSPFLGPVFRAYIKHATKNIRYWKWDLSFGGFIAAGFLPSVRDEQTQYFFTCSILLLTITTSYQNQNECIT